MDNELELKTAYRQMLLPIPAGAETVCMEEIKKVLNTNKIDVDQHAQFLKLTYDKWRANEAVNPILKEAIQTAINVSGGVVGPIIASSYFDVQNILRIEPFINFELSIITLSHARLILKLAHVEKMSSAKILKVIKSIDERLSLLSWKHIQRILSLFKCQPILTQNEVSALYADDEKLELEYFADADIYEAALLVGQIADTLQFNYNASLLLHKLSKDDEAHLPYLQILHYQCLISGFFDHVFPIMYEFNPRGTVANWLFEKWGNLVHTSNPILNNAKSVHILDENWANSKKQNEYEQAASLVEILKGLDEMGFSAAQELSSWIRSWLIRFIRLNTQTIVPIPNNLSHPNIEKILNYVTANPTNTYGILEQRYTDVIASYLHSESQWRSRGLGDSVNANNNSKRKLGDCDFQNSVDRIIVAYEAHGGKLSELYLDGHIRTLRRTLLRRVEELETVASISEWKLELNFISYAFDVNLPSKIILDGLHIDIKYKTFAELGAMVDNKTDQFHTLFNGFFVDVINNRRTPAFVREKIHKIVDPKSRTSDLQN